MAFSRLPILAADSSFSATGATAWNTQIFGVSGATVGAIAYFPNATTEAMSGMTWNASGTAGEGLVVAAGTAASALQALSITQGWGAGVSNTTGGIRSVVTQSSAGTGSLLLNLLYGASGSEANKFGVNVYGYAGNFATTTGAAAFGVMNNDTFRTGMSVGASPSVAGDAIGFHISSSASVYYLNATGISAQSNRVIGFSSSSADASNAPDSAFSRIAAGLGAFGTGAQGSFAGRLKLTSEIVASVTVGTLNASPTQGEIQSVTDSLAPAWGVQVAAGGAAFALVCYNGAQWRVIGI